MSIKLWNSDINPYPSNAIMKNIIVVLKAMQVNIGLNLDLDLETLEHHKTICQLVECMPLDFLWYTQLFIPVGHKDPGHKDPQKSWQLVRQENSTAQPSPDYMYMEPSQYICEFYNGELRYNNHNRSTSVIDQQIAFLERLDQYTLNVCQGNHNL